MKEYNFGLRGHDIAADFISVCKTAKEHKIKKLQLALAKTVKTMDFDKVGYDEVFASYVNEELSKHNLDVPVLGCYINPVEINYELRKVQLKRFENFLYYARKIGAGGVGTETGALESVKKTHTSETYKKFLNNMIPLIEVAEKLGTKVLIEPVWIYTIYSPESMKMMIDDVKSDSLGVILDVSNMMTVENVGEQEKIIYDSFELFGDRISAIHLKDFNFENGLKRFAVPTEGQLNIKLMSECIKGLKHTPDIILDELPIRYYEDACVMLRNL